MRRTAATVIIVCGLVAIPMAANAHPLGNFTINQFLGLMVTSAAVEIDYVLDMAEIPAFQERQAIDTNGDEEVSQQEEDAYQRAACSERAAGITLSYDGRSLVLVETGSDLSFPEGQAGLVTLRLECSYRAEGRGISLLIENGNYAQRTGWREIVVDSSEVDISSELPATSLSARLTAYPKDPSAATPDIRNGVVIIGGAGVSHPLSPTVVAAPTTGTPVDALGSLISRGDLGTGAALVALAAAVALGAGHALAPGHGKTIMAAYLVGNRGTVRQALGLGLSVAVSHTMGVLALGLATMVATRSFQPERVYPYLSAASGLIVLGIGVGLMIRSFRRIRHEQAHRHGHDHHHDHHHDPGQVSPRIGWKGLMALGLTGELVPSASAVVLLLGAVNLGRVEFGLALVAAFGLGMATAMVAVGLSLVAATRLGIKKLSNLAWLPRLTATLPAAMGVVVTVVGVAMLLTAGRNLIGA